MRRGLRRAPVRVSAADRARALAQVDAMAEQGLIRGDDELKARRDQIRNALYPDEIQAALANLPATLKPTDPPASDTDREDAIRKVRLHESVGHLTSAEADKRVEIIYTCRTRQSIAAVLADLPAVERREVSHRISQRDRDEALRQLDKALDDGRMTVNETVVARAQVEQARTRQELNAAFRGLTNPAVAAAGRTAAGAGLVAAEGGRRVLIAFLRWVVAVVVAIAGIVTLALGYYVLGGVLLGLGVVIWVSSIAALFASRRRR